MGRSFAEAFPICGETMVEADTALGDDLSGLCFNGPEERLVLTENTQPAILAVSVAIYRLLESRGVQPAMMAGHSLGEYSAHVAAGTLAFADALRIVRQRGRACRRPCRWVTAPWPHSRPDPQTVAQACAEAARRGGQSRESQHAGPGGIAGTKAAVARASERASAWRQASGAVAAHPFIVP